MTCGFLQRGHSGQDSVRNELIVGPTSLFFDCVGFLFALCGSHESHRFASNF